MNSHSIWDSISKLKVLWKEWNIRSFIIASFVFQLLLILFAPFRKHTSNGILIFSIWLSYLLADFVAIQAVGLISRSSDNSEDILFAFWSQFLLLHLGGPDTITALAVEDNELWLRTALQLGVQVYATFGILIKTIQHSSLRIPTILMFFAGVIKYLERVFSLFYGQLSNFDEDEDDKIENLLEEYEPKKDSGQSNVEMVRNAFYFFHYFKGMLFADRVLTRGKLSIGAEHFYASCRSPEKALRVIEIEFSFAYEVIYTKMAVIHKKIGKVLRPIVTLISVACLVTWHFAEKQGFHSYDIRITYALLVGAIAVDVLAFFRILLSDWNVAHIKSDSLVSKWILNPLLSAQKRTWGRYSGEGEAPFQDRIRRAFLKRWSESVSQFNLIDYCVDQRSNTMQKAIEMLHVQDILDGNKYVKKRWFSDEFMNIIFEKIWPNVSQGEYEFFNRLFDSHKDWGQLYVAYLEHKLGVRFPPLEFDICLLVWHIATEVCYSDVLEFAEEPDLDAEPYMRKSIIDVIKSLEPNKESLWKRISGWMQIICRNKAESRDNENASPSKKPKNKYKEFSKAVSDYLLYLLIRQPKTIPALVSGETKPTFKNTCGYLKNIPFAGMAASKEVKHQAVCYFLANEVVHESEEGNQTLRMGQNLAKRLKEEGEDVWGAIAGVWVLFLCYAAKQCKPNVHAAQLKQGGELLSFVWLLMKQLGFGQQILVGYGFN